MRYLQVQLVGVIVAKVTPYQQLHCEAKQLELSWKGKKKKSLGNLVASSIYIEISIFINRKKSYNSHVSEVNVETFLLIQEGVEIFYSAHSAFLTPRSAPRKLSFFNLLVRDRTISSIHEGTLFA